MHQFGETAVPSKKVAVHWFGQNSFAFKSPKGTTVLMDPYFPHDRPREKYIHSSPPVREADLPVDAVLLTHDHSDHTHPETLLRIAEAHGKVRFVGPKESVDHLSAAGIERKRLLEIGSGEQTAVADVVAHAVFSKPPEGDPASGIGPSDVSHLGYVLVVGDVRIYVSGDCIRTIARLDGLTEPVRTLRPTIGFLTTHPTEGEFPFFEDSLMLAQRVGLCTVFPAHYECFVSRTFDPSRWAEHFRGSGIEARTIDYNSHVLVP